ncbi:TPA: AlpA family phage regulatory protein [Yersinia enterocolitica]|nr:AlpA family phage regulatory protein [Yersinia enterocolitica]
MSNIIAHEVKHKDTIKIYDPTSGSSSLLINIGEFPKPIKLGRSSRWLQSEVEAWVQQRITDSRSS